MKLPRDEDLEWRVDEALGDGFIAVFMLAMAYAVPAYLIDGAVSRYLDYEIADDLLLGAVVVAALITHSILRRREVLRQARNIWMLAYKQGFDDGFKEAEQLEPSQPA